MELKLEHHKQRGTLELFSETSSGFLHFLPFISQKVLDGHYYEMVFFASNKLYEVTKKFLTGFKDVVHLTLVKSEPKKFQPKL